MRAVISFLTKIPTKPEDLEVVARHAYFFPIAGFLIGFIVYIVGYVVFKFLPIEIAAIITVIALYTVTGLIHLDGLSDFSDGVMAKGNVPKKIAVMKDVRVGIAGIFSVLIVLILTFCCIKSLGANSYDKMVFSYEIPMYRLGSALILSELSAKLSMNTCIAFGKKTHSGLGAVFIEQSTHGKYGIVFLTTLAIGVLLAGFYFVLTLTGLAVGMVVLGIAHKSFGFVSGDAMGASNELARVASLVLASVIL